MLGRFAGDALPALYALLGRNSEMLLGAARDDRDDSCDVQLGTFFDCPLHAIELEDGQQQSDRHSVVGGDFFAERELHTIIADAGYGRAAHLIAASYFELLADPRAQGSCQMGGVLAGEGGAVGGELVGNPATAGHRVKSNRAVAMAMAA